MNKTIQFIKRVFINKWAQLALRLILGGTFILASIDKLVHPTLFAEAIYSYQLLPLSIVNLAAATLPMLELVAGVTIIMGLWTRASSFILSGLTLIFIVAISINLIRGLEIACGCFEVISDSKIGIDLLIRDILLLIAGVIIIAVKYPVIAVDYFLNKRKED